MWSGLLTRLVQLFQQLVVRPPQLGPLGELILAAGRVELAADLEVLLLCLALLRELSRQLGWDEIY